jgi:predicted phosphodiesterase
MKLHIISDLHLDSWPLEAPQDIDADVSIVLGDTHEGINGLEFIETLCKGRPILSPSSVRPTIVLLGNHEFYGSSLAKVRAQWREIAAKNSDIIFLDNEVWIHKGVRFIGATLWTDFFNQSPLKMMQGQGVVKDYMYIENDQGDDHINADFILSEHLKSKQFIQDELSKPFEGKTVVLTHHAPTHSSVAEHFQGNEHNYMFCSDLDAIFHYQDFVLWAHGHMHNSAFYKLADKWVLNNPRGTPSYPNDQFDVRFVIDLDNMGSIPD